MDGFKFLGCIFTGVVDDVGVTVVWVENGLNGGWLGWGIVEDWCVVVGMVDLWWCGVVGECLVKFGCDEVGVRWVVLDVGCGRL